MPRQHAAASAVQVENPILDVLYTGTWQATRAMSVHRIAKSSWLRVSAHKKESVARSTLAIGPTFTGVEYVTQQAAILHRRIASESIRLLEVLQCASKLAYEVQLRTQGGMHVGNSTVQHQLSAVADSAAQGMLRAAGAEGALSGICFSDGGCETPLYRGDSNTPSAGLVQARAGLCRT